MFCHILFQWNTAHTIHIKIGLEVKMHCARHKGVQLVAGQEERNSFINSVLTTYERRLFLALATYVRCPLNRPHSRYGLSEGQKNLLFLPAIEHLTIQPTVQSQYRLRCRGSPIHLTFILILFSNLYYSLISSFFLSSFQTKIFYAFIVRFQAKNHISLHYNITI